MAGLRNVDGLVTETEGDLIDMTIDAFLDRLWRQDRRRRSEGDAPEFSGADGSGEPAEDADDADTPAPADAGSSGGAEFSGADGSSTHPVTRVDALMAIFRVALAHLSDLDTGDGSADPVGDRYLVHYIHHVGSGLTTRPDGSPVHPDVAGPIVCGGSRVDHHVGDQGETLFLGRRQRNWSTAQRRAISVRDGGRCRYPGCDNRRVQIHHVRHWEHGGPTDLDNGASLCPRHHSLHHNGFIIEGQPDGTLTFARPDGTPIGTTGPRMTPLVDPKLFP